jgi:hypothetical protein
MPAPRRLNFVSLLLLAGIAAGGYWLWKFFPVYYTGWQVDHVLSEAGARVYQSARQPEPARSNAREQAEAEARAKVAALGVDDPELAVRIDLDEQFATATADYAVVVQHAVIDKRVLVRVHRSARTDIKKVQW